MFKLWQKACEQSNSSTAHTGNTDISGTNDDNAEMSLSPEEKSGPGTAHEYGITTEKSPLHPTKKRKRDYSGSPDLNETERSIKYNSHYNAMDIVNVLEQVTRLNTIALVNESSTQEELILRVLLQAASTERLRIQRSSSTRRFALLLVEDEKSVQPCTAKLVNVNNQGLRVRPFVRSTQGLPPQWTRLFSADIVVTHPQLLLESLVEGNLVVSQIHLLVISNSELLEHNQASHPVSRIANDFYRTTDNAIRPHVLVVFNSRGLHNNADVAHLISAFEAEACYVFANSSIDALEEESSADRPMEMVVVYDPPYRTNITPLWGKLRERDIHHVLPRRHFRAARHVLIELGTCASDLIWRRALEEIEIPIPSPRDLVPPIAARMDIKSFLEDWVFDMPSLTSKRFNVTPKSAKLLDILKACQPYGESFRSLILVKRRATATLMVDMLQSLDDDIPFIRPYFIVGHGPFSAPEIQQQTLRDFAVGTYNILVVTKSVEDLDFPGAPIVIRYDLFEDPLSYAYSRAGAQGEQSHVIHMVEKGNDVHKRILSDTEQANIEVRRWISTVARDGGSSVPPKSAPRILDPYRSDSEDEDSPEPHIQDPTTGARVYERDATAVIYRFVANLPKNDGVPNRPLFVFSSFEDGKFRCKVRFPGSKDMPDVCGPACISQSLARRAACYKACQELFKKGLLDYRLLPRPSRTSDASRGPSGEMQTSASIDGTDERTDGSPLELHTSHQGTGTHCYPRKRTSFWKNSLQSFQGCLYPLIVSPGPLRGEQHAPMLILTRLPFPDFADFSVFALGLGAEVHFQHAAPMDVAEHQLEWLHAYTLRIARSFMNKPFTCPLESMAYFFAPLGPTWTEPDNYPSLLSGPSIAEHIPWEHVKIAGSQWMSPLVSEDVPLEEAVKDAVIQDRWVEFTNRHYAVTLRPDLNPLSKVDDSPREAAYANFFEYCKARRKDFEGLKSYTQPLVEVTPVPVLLNYLDPASKPQTPPKSAPPKYLIPELCTKFIIPASTFRTAQLLPSIIYKIDDLLIAKELNAKYFDHAIPDHHLLAALSPPSVCVETDYERLELFGDAFLKYVASVYCFVTIPSQDEGVLSIARGNIVKNTALLHGAIQAGLPPYIQSKPFVAKIWQPVVGNASAEPPIAGEELENGQDSVGDAAPKLSKRKRQQSDRGIQWLGDKTVADVVEAIIGGAYLAGGRDLALQVTKTLNVVIIGIDRWTDFASKTPASPPGATITLSENTVNAVEDLIGCTFSKPHVLAQALTHSSQMHEGQDAVSYERLEYLGDAVLDFLVVQYIFDRHPQLSPGGLTMLKAAMVSNPTLAALCVQLGLFEHIQFTGIEIATAIQIYVQKVTLARNEEYRLATQENRLPGQYWLAIEPPKVLSDVIESIIGALFVCDSFTSIGVESLFENILQPFYDHHIRLQTLSHHPNKTLFELLQREGCHRHLISKEKIAELTRCDVIVHDIILASECDVSAAVAMRGAAMCALDALDGDPDFMARTCDCRANLTSKKVSKDVLGYGEDDEESLVDGGRGEDL